MAILLDTHAFLWFVSNDPRLSETAARRIADEPRVVVSVVTAWELVIKQGIGKLVLDRPLKQLWPESLETNGFTALDVTSTHVLAVQELPLHHRDPFDRLLIAQAISEDLELVSADASFAQYAVRRVW